MSAVKDGKVVPYSEIYGQTQFNVDHLEGMAWMLQWLHTSPRMHKPQCELLIEQYRAVIAEINRRAEPDVPA